MEEEFDEGHYSEDTAGVWERPLEHSVVRPRLGGCMTDQPSRKKRTFNVFGPGLPGVVEVTADNWVLALEMALRQVEQREWSSRLHCEIHPDGTVVASDDISGLAYVIRPKISSDGSGARGGAAAAQGSTPSDVDMSR
ncbi:MAG: hypothetical protein EA397_15720 [Deltaproteobacteria bacterium]|nr:MAG: hypothetical protein EA397_15720 [Deltaproteobacteria bacterium]